MFNPVISKSNKSLRILGKNKGTVKYMANDTIINITSEVNNSLKSSDSFSLSLRTLANSRTPYVGIPKFDVIMNTVAIVIKKFTLPNASAPKTLETYGKMIKGNNVLAST